MYRRCWSLVKCWFHRSKVEKKFKKSTHIYKCIHQQAHMRGRALAPESAHTLSVCTTTTNIHPHPYLMHTHAHSSSYQTFAYCKYLYTRTHCEIEYMIAKHTYTLSQFFAAETYIFWTGTPFDAVHACWLLRARVRLKSTWDSATVRMI